MLAYALERKKYVLTGLSGKTIQTGFFD